MIGFAEVYDPVWKKIVNIYGREGCVNANLHA